MRVVCPLDVKKMLLKQARMVHCKRWAAKHECEELKEGVRAMLRRNTHESHTEKHRNEMRKLVAEAPWVQKRLYDIGWSDEKKCRGCNKEARTEKHRLCHCPSLREVRNQIPEGLGKHGCEEHTRRRKTGHDKEAVTSHLLSGSHWREQPLVSPKVGV